MPHELSLMDAAVQVMSREKQSFDVYDLFDRVVEMLNLSEEQQAELVDKFYTDLTTSAKFIYVGDNRWNLKANEKVELWEKDGSFYKEYTIVELPEEYKTDPYARQKKVKPKIEVKPEVVEEEIIPEAMESQEDIDLEPVVDVIPEVIEPVAEEEPDKDTPADLFAEPEEYEEEVFEDYDDFDEEKYNEYMDNYEDQYDD